MRATTAMGCVWLAIALFPAASMCAPEWVSLWTEGPVVAPQMTIVEQASDHLVLRWEVGGVFVESVTVPEGTFQRLSLDRWDTYQFGNSGEPGLPALFAMVCLPQATRPVARVSDAEWTTLGVLRPFPKQPPRRDDDSAPPAFQFNRTAYLPGHDYPSETVRLSPVGEWGGLAVVGLAVVPLRYHSEGNLVTASRRITVRIDFLPGGPDFERPTRKGRRLSQIQRRVLVNPPPQAWEADENEPTRMLMIMWDEARDIMQPVFDYHYRTGLNPEILEVQGDESPEDIREEIRNRYREGLEYVLIVGDARSDAYHVPMKYWNSRYPGRYPEEGPFYCGSDSWYACLGPQIGGYDDNIPDLAVGRILYDRNNLAQLEDQVAKLTDYLTWSFEDPRDAEWLSRAVMMAHRDDEYITCKTTVMERDYRLDHPEFVRIFGTDANVNNTTVINLINDRGVGLFNYRGHGDWNIWASWRPGQSWGFSQISQLNNRNRPFVLISSACTNAEVYEAGRPDCLLERFSKRTVGGSVAAHGSIISTFTDGNTYFDKAVFRALFDDGIYDIGFAAVQAEAEMVQFFDAQEGPNGYMMLGRLNTRAYMWMGDPAMELRDRAPADLTVNFFPLPQPGDTVVRTRITSAGEPIPDVRFCLRSLDGQVYVVGISDAHGYAEVAVGRELENNESMSWTAYHRNAQEENGVIVVTQDAGTITGRVTDLARGIGVPEASVTIYPFDYSVFTNQAGYYHITGVPTIEATLRAAAAGYLTQERQVQVVGHDTVIVDFEMRFAQLAFDSARVLHHLEAGDEALRRVNLRNTGNGPLEWSATKSSRGDQEPYALINSIDLSAELNDSRLYGVEFIDGEFYVTGGNNNADPNFVYILDREGRLTGSFQQPWEAAGTGFRDLAWDGDYLYGSSNTTSIYRFDRDGNVERIIQGPYAPSIAITADPDGFLWVGKDREPLAKIDLDGNVLQTIRHDLNVRALAWHREADSGDHLLMLVADDPGRPVALYRANPIRGDVHFAANLTAHASDLPREGLAVSGSWRDGQWVLLGMVGNGDSRFVRIWNLGLITDWLQFYPDSGTIAPGAVEPLYLVLNAREVNDQRLTAQINFHTNGYDPDLTLPVVLEVGEVSVPRDQSPPSPAEFRLEGIQPNPFNDRTVASLFLPAAGWVVVDLLDIQGRLAARGWEGRLDAGHHSIAISAHRIPAGLYVVSADFAGVRRMAKAAVLR